jgi:hypothetical protein
MPKHHAYFSFHLKAKTALAVLLTLLYVTVLTVGTVNAAKLKPPRPTATPVPTATPAPVPTSVPTPSAFTITNNVPDNFAVLMSPATQLGDAELLSGPTIGGPAIVLVSDGGRVSFLRLAENSDYVFQYRNKIWIPSTASFIFSPWVQFSFHTPTFDSLRPAAPQNVRVVEQTATTVTVRWDAVPTAVRYDYSLNGGAPIQTGVCSGVYCTPTDPLTATFARPAAGTSVLFSVTATRSPGQYGGGYQFPDNRFITSLPTTITVSN